MALNDVALCSRALIRLGAAPITSFTDGTAESEIAGALYTLVRDALLCAYPWSFAYAQTPLSKLVTPPAADYQNAFGLPVNCLRVLSAGQSGQGRGVHYRLAQKTIQTNAENILLSYIFRPVEADCPAYFDLALMARLSAEFCIPITENTGRYRLLLDIAQQEYARARQIDAQQDSPARLEHFTLIDSRG